MKEVFKNLYVGNQQDYETSTFTYSEWAFLLAAKEPWHRRALGYTGRAADKNDPEYLMAKHLKNERYNEGITKELIRLSNEYGRRITHLPSGTTITELEYELQKANTMGY